MSVHLLASKFMDLFSGLERAYGRYTIPPPEKRKRGSSPQKVKGTAATVHEPVTVELWSAHLLGTQGLGIVPIRDDANVRFAAIDVDKYDVNISALYAQVKSMKLPLIPARTKSGGAHLYIFCREPVSAALVRQRLLEWSVLLGHSGSEIFPKQEKLASRTDFGNWINMPYFDEAKTDRYAYTGEPLTASEFLEAASRGSVVAEDLEDFSVEEDGTAGVMLEEAPPCLQSLAKTGAPDGTRNKAMFNFAIYVKKRWPDDWEKRVDQYNSTFMKPPLGHKEVLDSTKSVRKKDYLYTCKEEPLKSVCSRALCLKRKFGISGGVENDPGCTFGALVKLATDPPTWIWDVDGIRLELSTDELMDQRGFQRAVFERLNKLIYPVSKDSWADLIRGKLKDLEIQEAPPDASQEGQIYILLEEFCSTRSARTMDEVLLGRVFTDEDRTFFRYKDFKKYMRNQGITGITDQKVWNMLRKRGSQHHVDRIKGRSTRFWSVPGVERQTESYGKVEIPEILEGKEF